MSRSRQGRFASFPIDEASAPCPRLALVECARSSRRARRRLRGGATVARSRASLVCAPWQRLGRAGPRGDSSQRAHWSTARCAALHREIGEAPRANPRTRQAWTKTESPIGCGAEISIVSPYSGWLGMPGTSNSVVGGGLSSRIGKRVDAISVDGSVS